MMTISKAEYYSIWLMLHLMLIALGLVTLALA
jgi:hypothetical protein